MGSDDAKDGIFMFIHHNREMFSSEYEYRI